MKNRSRSKLLLYNAVTSLSSQIITLICNFVLTRLILQRFGSSTNGLVSSVTQFLGFIAFLEIGIGAVIKSALYKPLADKNSEEISKVLISSKRFFKKIAMILLAYTAILMIVLPNIFKEEYSMIFTASLVIIISISLFAQYFLGMPYQLLLNADQKTYIPTITCCMTLILNTLVSAVLIWLGASIQIVKLATSLIYIMRPLFYNYYVHKKYRLNEHIILNEEPLKQKWNGLAQHLAYVVVNYTDIAVLTFFSTLANVSVYTVYHNVTIGIQQVISGISVGFSAMLGNVLYSENKEKLKETFGIVEWFFHSISILLFTITGLMIVPFATIYTNGITDVSYNVPLFAFFITLAQTSYSIRIPYETMVLAANHFKSTQKSAIIEAVLNLSISIILVHKYGLIGVAIGTFIAMMYRTVYFVFFLRKNTLEYSLVKFLKYILLDVLQVLLSVLISNGVFGISLSNDSWVSWIYMGIKNSAICLIVCIVINLIFYRQYLFVLIKKVKRKK